MKTTWGILWGQALGRVAVIVFAAAAVIYLFELGSDDLRVTLSVNLDRLMVPVLAGLLYLRTRNVESIEERRFWGLLLTGMILWFTGAALFLASYTLGLPGWADLVVDVCYILLYLCWVLASDQQPQLESGWSGKDVLYRFSLVGATLFIALMFGYFVVVPWSGHPTEYSQYFASFNLYVTLDTLLTLKFFLLFLSARSPRWKRCFALIGSATAVLALGDLLEGLGFAEMIETVMGARIDVIWLVPHFLLLVMILTCTDRPTGDQVADESSAKRIQSLLPFYAFALPLVHLGLYLLDYLNPAFRTPREAIVFSGLVIFAVLSLAQQVDLERAVASLRSDLVIRALDDKLRQSQRLESIGRLAGGIAHDFNNLLMVIKSYAELASQRLRPVDREVQEKLVEIDRAADRAADLIRQLLAFGRRQVLRPEVVPVNDLVQGLEGMLDRIIGDNIELVVTVDPNAGFTKVDPALLEQVIVNLAVNARDAMPRGGRLDIGTGLVNGPNDQTRSESERWIELSVADTGLGIDAAIRDRIFDPYFTTKEMEKGTGLGLATVYGIVEQSGGTIDVESEPDNGAIFRVRLPQVEGPPSENAAQTPQPEHVLAGETVLLTEDEENIRETLAEYLESLGMEVLQAVDGVDALEVAAAYDGAIDILVTDLVMPRMSGPELATQLLPIRDDLKVIYVSGFTPEAMRDHGVANDDAVFLQKPFLLLDLANTIRDVLDG